MILDKLTDATDSEKCEDFLSKVVIESIMCLGRTNSVACRKAASNLIFALPSAMKTIKNCDEETAVVECMRLLYLGLLDGTSPTLKTNTITGITVFIHLAKDVMPVSILEQIIGNVTSLMRTPVREIVQACLSCIKGIISSFAPNVLGSAVSTIMEGIANLTPDCLRKYRQKTKSILTRLLRKFGDDYICNLVPQQHESLHKILRNLRKEVNRERRLKEAEDKEEETEDKSPTSMKDLVSKKNPTSLGDILAEIDDDLDEGENDAVDRKKESRKNKAAGAWIADDQDSDEDILDLMADNAADFIFSSKPVEKRTFEAKGER